MFYSIPTYNYFGKDSLAYWENFLTDDDINILLAQPEWLNMQVGRIGGSSGADVLDPSIRANEIAWLHTKPELIPIWKKLAHVTAEVNSRFFHFDITGFHEPMQLGLYTGENKGHYNWHIDSGVDDRCTPRKLSLAMLLSDSSEFEGGEFQVKTDNDTAQTLECKRGRAWFFPSYTLHRVAPVTKGVRRSLVLWVGGPPFR
jgi:PKHD-type hydroxylase